MIRHGRTQWPWINWALVREQLSQRFPHTVNQRHDELTTEMCLWRIILTFDWEKKRQSHCQSLKLLLSHWTDILRYRQQLFWSHSKGLHNCIRLISLWRRLDVPEHHKGPQCFHAAAPGKKTRAEKQTWARFKIPAVSQSPFTLQVYDFSRPVWAFPSLYNVLKGIVYNYRLVWIWIKVGFVFQLLPNPCTKMCWVSWRLLLL